MEIDPRCWNLAPWFFRNALHAEGGPIKSVKVSNVENTKYFEAHATLDLPIDPIQNPKGNLLYGNHHGTGTDVYRHVATYKAISEALERWAFYVCCADNTVHRYLGLDLVPTTTGFAAFPALSSAPARERAYFEACERWILCEWWEGRLPARPIHESILTGLSAKFRVSNLNGWQLSAHSMKDSATVILRSKCSNGLFAFGFACSAGLKAATAKALIELERNIWILERHAVDRQMDELSSLNEKRLIYFSETRGLMHFERVLTTSLGMKESMVRLPTPIVDQEVVGPWSQYAKVWRVLFGVHPKSFDRNILEYFLF
jgi:hypothetical protein